MVIWARRADLGDIGKFGGVSWYERSKLMRDEHAFEVRRETSSCNYRDVDDHDSRG